MQTLSYGFLKPQTGDTGAVFFPALETDIQKLNDHTHDGSNSAKLTAASSAVVTQAILAAAWVSLGGGMYRQAVTLAGSLLYDTVAIEMRLTATKHQAFLQVEKINATSYYVYINDNTLDVTAVYSS